MAARLCAAGAPLASRSHHIADVPFYQNKDDQCGPASLAGVLNYWGDRSDPESLKKEFFVARLKGSLAMDLVQAARNRGFKAEVVSGSMDLLKEEILKGHPAIALLNLGYRFFPKGHFIIVTGFDDDKQGLLIHSGKPDEFLSYRRFLKHWEKTGRALILIAPAVDQIDRSNIRP